MEEKQLKKEIKRIHKAIKKMERIPQYNLSGSAWQDHYTSRERDRMYKRSERNFKKRRDCASAIADMIMTLKISGYPIDDILKGYDKYTIADIMYDGGIEELKQHYIKSNPFKYSLREETPSLTEQAQHVASLAKKQVKNNEPEMAKKGTEKD